MRKIKVVVLLVQQLQHGFTKNAKVSPNLTVALIVRYIANQLRIDFTTVVSSSIVCWVRLPLLAFVFIRLVRISKHLSSVLVCKKL